MRPQAGGRWELRAPGGLRVSGRAPPGASPGAAPGAQRQLAGVLAAALPSAPLTASAMALQAEAR